MTVVQKTDIHVEMLGDFAGMRSAIGQRYSWYYHLTPLANAEGIRQTGLEPRGVGTVPDYVTEILGDDGRKIICLHPLGASVVPPPVQAQRPLICLAVANADLPRRVDLDWSYGGVMELARLLRSDHSSRTAEDIFVEVVKRWGAIVSYDGIAPEHLRVCVQCKLLHDPSRWPQLLAPGSNMFHIE